MTNIADAGPMDGPGFIVRERVDDYEALLISEGLGVVEPIDADEHVIIMGGIHTGFNGEGAIDYVTEEIAAQQLLAGTGLTQRQYEVITLLAGDTESTADSVASDLEISPTMVYSHRRKARQRLEGIGASRTAVFDVEPSKGRKTPETIEEIDKLHARIENNYRHLHEDEDAGNRRRILEGLIRSTTRGFVGRDPDMSEILTVQELLKGYWSFELFGSVSRSVYRRGMAEQWYSGRIRDEIVNRSMTYLNQFMKTGVRPEGNAYNMQRNDPNRPYARHWYDTTDVRVSQPRNGRGSQTSGAVTPVASVLKPQVPTTPNSGQVTDPRSRLSRILHWRPWGRKQD